MISILGNVNNAGFALPMVQAYPTDPNQIYTLVWDPEQQALSYTALPATAALVGFLQQGVGAVVRSLQDRGRDWVSVLDYRDSPDSAQGNGVVNDYPMFARAIAANPGKTIYVPNPAVRYRNATGTFVLPAGTTLLGATRQGTQISHEFNGDLFSMGDRAAVLNCNLVGNGASYTGRCFVYTSTNGRQLVSGVRAQDWEDEVQYYGVDAGSQCYNIDVVFSRRNAGTGTGRYAVVIEPTAKLTAAPRHFIGLETDGQCAIDFGGCNNVLVTSSIIADVRYTPETRAASITNTRMLNQAALTFDGHNNVIDGCDVFPQITFAVDADNCHLGTNTYNNLPIIDNSGNNRNTMTHWPIVYTPVLTSGGTAPSLGNGTITGWVARQGGTTTIEGQLVLGSTTSLGSGALRVSLPHTRFGAGNFVGGSVHMNRGGTIYTGILQITGGVATFASLVRDTSGSVTFNSPAVFATGDTIRWSATYTN